MVVDGFPIGVVIFDYLMGMVMWTLIGRFAMGIFLPPDHHFFFNRFFIRVTDPLVKVFKPITPSFLLQAFVPLYVAWFFFMIRFYLMPWALGYSVMGMLSFPLESEIAQGVAAIVGYLMN